MKILHCCLAAFYIDNFGYQENILPKFHKRLGHEVKILASTENYIDNSKFGYVKSGEYLNDDDIVVTRLPYVKWLPSKLVKKLRIYSGITKYLNTFRPDIIFLHDSQFLSIRDFKKYAIKNDVKIIIDSHTDYINSGKNWISLNILHKVVYRYCAKLIEQYVSVFFATLPIRTEFLIDVYGMPRKKIKLLPFGVDDSLFKLEDKAKIRIDMRNQLGYGDHDLVIISGGKIDIRKNIHVLMESFIEYQEEFPNKNIKLLVFGKPVEELERIINVLSMHEDVLHIEWIGAKDIHKYLLASDLAIFPGTHSVLWEEAVGVGLPCVFKRWKGITHVDVGGNCKFIESGDLRAIKEVLVELISDKDKFQEMKRIAESLGPKYFSYSNIANDSIDI